MRRYCARECRFRHNAPSRPSGVNGARVRNGTTPGGHVRRSTLRTAVAVVTAGLTLTACGSGDGGSGGGGSGGGGSGWGRRPPGGGPRGQGGPRGGGPGGGGGNGHPPAPGRGQQRGEVG